MAQTMCTAVVAATAVVVVLCSLPAQGIKTPEYKLVSAHKGYEERLYEDTEWITAKLEGLDTSSIMEARAELKDYCESCGIYDALQDFWPILATSRGKEPKMSLSWFVPPGTAGLKRSDVVRVEKRSGVFYVKSFKKGPLYIPNMDTILDEVKQFREELRQDDQAFDGLGYSLAVYKYTFETVCEIWIRRLSAP